MQAIVKRSNSQSVHNRSLDSFWMPFTANQQFKQNPKLLVSANGMFYQSDDGRTILDGTAGLWCCNAGHNREQITQAVSAQLRQLDYGPCFQLGHPIAFELAERLCDLAPDPLNHVFFTNSGSESVDTSLKIALAYQRAIGQGTRTRLIGRERGYHGVGFGGIAVGGIGSNRRSFATIVTGTDHLPAIFDLEHNAFSTGIPEYDPGWADSLESLVALHGAENIAAVIVEPIAGSTGVLIPPHGYLKKLRDICTRYSILLIFDEVITGYGRTGHCFASEQFDVTPDIITTAKGLTNGTIPMGAVFVQDFIYDALINEASQGIELFHGYTYSGHPVAAAAALATLDIYHQEQLFERSQMLAPFWQQVVHQLKGLPHVIDIRNYGLIAGIELASIPNAIGSRAFQVFEECFNRGLLIRVTGDIIALSPPLIIEKVQIEQLIDGLADVLKTITYKES
ncbi:MAG: Beta-alanine--pyruvate aminotransferase [Candidatus Celerinatantimonas neptuna]|nr:MAG: Beta-alanine--pyruvate aminotransferase [Candidatus Celerinatantimonas neptuna]